MSRLKAVVLAAGKGKRLGSETTGIPKVMRQVGGKPLLRYVVDALNLEPRDVILVVGYMKDAVLTDFPEHPYAIQEQQLGTGDAVKVTEPLLDSFDGSVLICCGDMPLIERTSYEKLEEVHRSEGNDVTIMTGVYPEMMPFGRVVRDRSGGFDRIVEAKDSDTEIDKIREYNAGIYIFEKQYLFEALTKITPNNAQGEYYLTDAPAIIKTSGGKVGLCSLGLGTQMVGVSTEQDILQIEEILKSKPVIEPK